MEKLLLPVGQKTMCGILHVINARMESYERRLPPFMRHPISRGDKHLAEVREVEEMWN